MVPLLLIAFVFVWMELLGNWDGRVIPITAKASTSLEGNREGIDVL